MRVNWIASRPHWERLSAGQQWAHTATGNSRPQNAAKLKRINSWWGSVFCWQTVGNLRAEQGLFIAMHTAMHIAIHTYLYTRLSESGWELHTKNYTIQQVYVSKFSDG